MHLIGEDKIDRCKRLYPKGSGSLDRWKKVVKETAFTSTHELKRTFPKSYDFVRPHCHVFDISNNRYRIIALIDFETEIVSVVDILDHATYDKWECK